MKCEMPLCKNDDNIIYITDMGKLCDRCRNWLKKQKKNMVISAIAEIKVRGKNASQLITGT